MNAQKQQLRRPGTADGLPIPPAHLMHLVAGTDDLEWFLTGGQRAAEAIRTAVAAVGRPLESLESVLDWGCGSGRVIRHFHDVTGPRFYGCDFNRELVEWSRSAYPHARFEVNQLLPPLPFGDAFFDLVYGLSVLTHLPHEVLASWMDELARVLRPGGLALLTTHGAHYLNLLTPEEKEQFHGGRLVVRYGSQAGTNECVTFCSDSYVRHELAAAHGFEVVLFEPEGAWGNPFQDLYLLQRKSGTSSPRRAPATPHRAALPRRSVAGAGQDRIGSSEGRPLRANRRSAPHGTAAPSDGFLKQILGRLRPPRSLRQLRSSLAWALGDAVGKHGVPPAYLRIKVHGSVDIPSFLAVGEHCARSLLDALERSGATPRDRAAVLDFGCGVGRTLVPLSRALPHSRLFGTDIDAAAIRWCQQNLDVATFAVNSPEPPLPYESEQFDVIYAVSVLTHLDEPMQFRWLRELQRVAKPGATLLLSVHGPSTAGILPAQQRPEYLQRGFCFTRSDIWSEFFPEFYHTALHTREYVEREWTKYFAVIDYLEKGMADHQDLVILRHRPDRFNGLSISSARREVEAVPGELRLPDAGSGAAAAGHIERLHWDGAGRLSTSGWLVVPDQEVVSFEVRIDGRPLGAAEPTDRHDVQQALPKLGAPRNSGFQIAGVAVPGARRGWSHLEVVGTTREGTMGSIETLYHPDAFEALPLPPPEFSMRVVNTTDAEFYRIGALRSFTAFLGAIRRHAPGPQDSLRVLDWGAGCGRLTAACTRFARFREVHACDIDPGTTGWAREQLGAEASFRVIDPYPPTPYGSGTFDVVVAYSVMTHLDRATQRQWLYEMRRLLRPGGLFLASVHGTLAARATFDPASYAQLLEEGIHDGIADPALDGIAPEAYYRGTFQTRAYTEREWGKAFDVLEYLERGMNNWQDLVVMRAPTER